MLGEQELCPATGTECAHVTELKRLFVGNSDRVDHGTATEDQNLLTAELGKHGDLLDARGDEKGPTPQGKCPLYETVGGKQAVKNLVELTMPRRHPI